MTKAQMGQFTFLFPKTVRQNKSTVHRSNCGFRFSQLWLVLWHMGILTKIHYREFRAYMAHQICSILLVATKIQETHEILDQNYKKETMKGKRKVKEKETKNTSTYLVLLVL